MTADPAPTTTDHDLTDWAEQVVYDGVLAQIERGTHLHDVVGANLDPRPIVERLLLSGPLADRLTAADHAAAALHAVLGVADALDGYARERGRPAGGSFDDGVNLAQADAAELIRAAVRGDR